MLNERYPKQNMYNLYCLMGLNFVQAKQRLVLKNPKDFTKFKTKELKNNDNACIQKDDE